MDALTQGMSALPIHAPVTVATNVALAVECALLTSWIRTDRRPPGRRWAGFFGWMAVATGVGAVKHGVGPSGAAAAFTAALLVSNLASAIAVHRAQTATIVTHAGPGLRPTLSRLATLQLVGFAAWTSLFPGAAAAVVNAALGLIPVVACEARAAGRCRGSGALVAGFALAAVAALVYGVGGRLPGPLGATDAAHLVMLGAFFLLGLGADARLHARTGATRVGPATSRGTP